MCPPPRPSKPSLTASAYGTRTVRAAVRSFPTGSVATTATLTVRFPGAGMRIDIAAVPDVVVPARAPKGIPDPEAATTSANETAPPSSRAPSATSSRYVPRFTRWTLAPEIASSGAVSSKSTTPFQLVRYAIDADRRGRVRALEHELERRRCGAGTRGECGRRHCETTKRGYGSASLALGMRSNMIVPASRSAGRGAVAVGSVRRGVSWIVRP